MLIDPANVSPPHTKIANLPLDAAPFISPSGLACVPVPAAPAFTKTPQPSATAIPSIGTHPGIMDEVLDVALLVELVAPIPPAPAPQYGAFFPFASQ
jgi:hypothetical protein